MKKSILIACIGFAALVAVGFRQADQTTPEATLKSFITAIAAADLKAAAGMVKGGKADFDYSWMTGEFKKRPFKLELLDLKAAVEGEKATASFKLRLTADQSGQPPDQSETIRLERVGAAWLIVPSASAGDKLSLGALAFILTNPSVLIEQARGAAQTTVCLSNLKQASLALIMLSADHDDVFKVKADSWKKAVMPYTKNEAIFHCPVDKSGAVSYSINPYIVGKSPVQIGVPAETVLVYEGRKLKLDFRHGGRACVAFADGHVKMFTAEQAKTLRWKP